MSASRAAPRSPDREPGAESAAARRIPLADPDYPERLRELSTPPELLWVIGDLATLAPPVVAVVGTRRATAYGERVTREIAGALARAGACVVSGLARGIDGVAHRAALDERGRTAAVLGTGVDVAYPAAHRPLHRLIGERGLLVSEFPLGATARQFTFPQRNRLIAALASVTIVIEARMKSGAMNTAQHAIALGRDVAAVPGPIDQPQSEGTNGLLRDGAHVIASVEDALALAGLTPPARGASAIHTEAERRVWEALAHGPLDMDALCARAGLPVRECVVAVGTLELSGALECPLTGEIRRR